MCTVSWLHTEDGYQLFCNRDEKKTRRPALPPRVDSREGVRFLAPADGDFGGTWIAVNEFGISVCLLNGKSSKPAANRLSRGLLPLKLIPSRSAREALDRFNTIDLAAFAPFTLAILGPRTRAAIAEWRVTGQIDLCEEHDGLPLTSSSFEPDRVRALRAREYARARGSLLEFHRSHANGPSAYSTCMHRPDAETVSFSRLRVTPSEANFWYSPGAPCRELPAMKRTLPLSR